MLQSLSKFQKILTRNRGELAVFLKKMLRILIKKLSKLFFQTQSVYIFVVQAQSMLTKVVKLSLCKLFGKKYIERGFLPLKWKKFTKNCNLPLKSNLVNRIPKILEESKRFGYFLVSNFLTCTFLYNSVQENFDLALSITL